MAGSMAIVVSDQLERGQWNIFFSRFVLRPFLTSTCPSLIPNTRARNRRSPGTWLSSVTPTASLHLIDCPSPSGCVLSVCFQGNILEEHYVSKLNFSWPQVSCTAGYPPRSIRTVFVSYKDSVGQIQKFALRFSKTSEAEEFINALKHILNYPAESKPPNSDFQSEMSVASAFLCHSGTSYRNEEDLSNTTPLLVCSPEVQLSLNYEVEQKMCTEKTEMNSRDECYLPALPPSFASYLTDCCSKIKQAQPSSTENMDLKSQIVRYMDDTSFQEMLLKVEKVVCEIEGDIMP
ncbi:hypothetical protein K2173_003264 [Erythroxylum novogranatense]|uniref:Poor homologous synapsis 1 PH domain-containing protein n=1 Tax=Erythroxylum novogranatense TaxID=1862640 RepID=A0AAV8SX44_9ROSI|nr:hypothetical protein K2173_003264 [Erythroxylum novogranatense]